MKVYAVYHIYDVDGGFGDPVYQDECICILKDKEDALALKEKLHNPRVYDVPYSQLYCGEIEIREMKVIKHKNFDIDKIDAYWEKWVEEYEERRLEEPEPDEDETEFDTVNLDKVYKLLDERSRL